ncbi:MAG: TonB-dependent receptor [Prevotellaceae bacterium]|jgi:TonB-linked SusC/RagA family outer membrane protein|nr:TonB-dependent receptor [Prevotellaceae bacterium]
MKIFFYRLKDGRALILCLLLFMFLANAETFAQNLSVKGKVIDSDGNVLPGTAVMVKDASIGTTTNDDGDYTLSNVPDGSILEFRLVGFVTQEIKVTGDRTTIVAIMVEESESLDEVTVVAFGKQKKSSVIASVESVKMSDLKVSASNLTSAFAGKIPGIISYQTTGEPGADNAQFFVRGVTTFGLKQDPLILIDGFEASSDDLARVQPDDVESFSILKDASATALYGARGANGIILVNTKAGKEGNAKVQARVDVHVAMPTRMNEMIDGLTYMRLYNQTRISRDPVLGPFYSEQKIQSTARGDNPMIYPNIDWYDMLFNKYTVNKKANVNISGGGKVATYYVAGGYDNESGLLKVDKRNNFNNNIDINRFHIRSNVIFKLTKTTTLDTRIQGRFERYTGPYESASNIFNMVMGANPVDFPTVYQPDEAHRFTEHILFGSKFVGSGIKENPYARMVQGYEDRNESTITAMATLSQDLSMIVDGLKLQAKASTNTWSKYSSRRSYTPYYYDVEYYNQITGEYKLFALNPTSGQAYLGDVIPGRDANARYYFELRLNWDKTFGKHSIGAMTVGMAEEALLTGGNSSSIYETLPEKNLGNSGRLTYDYDERYFFEFAYGYNGSEKFTGDRQFGFFPSFGVGWLISNEKFWTPMKDFIGSFKLKGTWGMVGNDAIAERKDRFFFLSDISLGGGSYRFGESFMNNYSGYSVNRYANPDITWEISNKYNLGIELGLFKDESLKFQIDFFKDIRSQIYMLRENFPATTGIETRISGNVGKFSSHGIDGSIDYQHYFNKDFWMTGRANLTYSTNKYIELDEKNYPDEYLKKKGHNVNQQWGLIAERLFVDEWEIQNSPKQDFGIYMAGDIKYKDVNGDGFVDNNDRVPIGHPTTPEIQYGFGLSAGYGNFDASFFFQGNARVSFFIDSQGYHDNTTGIAPFVERRNALAIVADDYWSETNPNVHAFWPRLSTEPLDNNTRQSTWWERDGSFLRLKTVEMGYSIPAAKKLHIENVRIYFSAENLFVISSFKLWDPEMGSKGLGYPLNRRFNVGIQLAL